MSVPEYDFLIAGSGVSGMTMAMLLARGGARVCMLEKSQRIGGSMQRFLRAGVPFDTGFHFTAGLGGVFGDMFEVLGCRETIPCVPVTNSFRIRGRNYVLPRGRQEIRNFLQSLFPSEAGAIQAFFEREKDIFDRTPLFRLSGGSGMENLFFPSSAEDQKTLTQTMDEFHFSRDLRLLLGGFAICCCGTPATEISFESFARINYGFYDDLVRFRHGGDDFIREFLRQRERYGIDLRTGTEIASCVPSSADPKLCHEIVTTHGDTITFGNAVFSIHPHAIAEILRPVTSNRSFFARTAEFEETCGYFTLWAVLDDASEAELDEPAEICSFFGDTPLERLLEKGDEADGVLAVTEETASGKRVRTFTAFVSVLEDETAEWKATSSGRRSASYAAYKEQKARKILESLYRNRPELEGRLTVVETASQLTYRDYLSPYGSAYGIRQKAGQYNIFGRLPVRNFYAIGQNSMLPGAIGAMQSAFLLWPKLAGEETCRKVLDGRAAS